MPKFKSDHWQIEIEQDWIDVTSDRPSYSERWEAIDSNGHPHAYQAGAGGPFPTLKYVVDEQHWCDGTEGWAAHDGHWQIDESHWECASCGEVVEPGTDPPGTPKQVPGMRSATISGPRSDGAMVRAALTEDELARVMARREDHAYMTTLVDAIPPERILSTQVSR